LALSENVRLSEQLEERDAALNQLRQELEQQVALTTSETNDDPKIDSADQTSFGGSLEDSYGSIIRRSINATEEIARDDLANMLREVNKQRELETSGFLNQLDAMLCRAVSAETRLAEAQCSLAMLSKESNAAITEHLRLSSRLAESDLELRAVRCELVREKTRSIAAEAENRELTVTLDKIEQARSEHIASLTSKVQAMRQRATEAEAFLVAMRQWLAEKLEAFQRSLDGKSNQIVELERSRAILAAGSNALLKQINDRDNALAEAKLTIGVLVGRVAKHGATLRAIEVRSAKMLLARTPGF